MSNFRCKSGDGWQTSPEESTLNRLFFNPKIIAAALSLCVNTAVWGADLEKLSPELKRSVATHSAAGKGTAGNSSQNVEVIVQYKVHPTAAHHGRVAERGGKLLHQFEHVKAAHYSVPASSLAELANDPDVAYISPNRPVKGMLNITAATVHSDIANAQGYTGAGIGVAVIDSGMADMPEFHNGPSRIVYQQSFVQNLPNLNANCPGGGANAGQWYSFALNIQGGLAPYSVSIASGALPLGLSLDASGNITGVPLLPTVGPAPKFTITLNDSYGNTLNQSCNLNVGPAGPAGPGPGQVQPLHLGCAGGGSQANTWYDSVLNAQGGLPPYKFSVSSGSLPAGLLLTAATGVISGSPTTATQGPQE